MTFIRGRAVLIFLKKEKRDWNSEFSRRNLERFVEELEIDLSKETMEFVSKLCFHNTTFMLTLWLSCLFGMTCTEVQMKMTGK